MFIWRKGFGLHLTNKKYVFLLLEQYMRRGGELDFKFKSYLEKVKFSLFEYILI